MLAVAVAGCIFRRAPSHGAVVTFSMPSNGSQATVASTVVLPFARLLLLARAQARRALLDETDKLLSTAGLSWQGILERTSPRIPQRMSVEILEASIAITGDQALGLHGAEASQPGDLEILEYLVRSCGTVGESIEVWRRYTPILLDADFELTREGKQLIGRLRFAPDLYVSPALVDYSLALAVLLTIRNAREPDPTTVQLQLKRRRPSYALEYQRILGHMPRFEQSYDGLVMTSGYEQTLMQQPDPVLHLLMSRQALVELESVRRHPSLTGRVRDAIARTLRRGAPLALVARELATSPATLRRRLANQGTNYLVLVEHARRDVALRELETQGTPVSDIALALGYNHASAFDRAFRRWYGRSPTEHRQAYAHRAMSLLDRRK
jgi:AraC-like DNA-binding protein